MDTDIKLLRAYTQLCVDASRALNDLPDCDYLYEERYLDLLWQLGPLAEQFGIFTDLVF